MSDSKFPPLHDLRRFNFICHRIRTGVRVSYRSVARASQRKYSFNALNRSVLRLEAYYKERLIQTGLDGGLEMTPAGTKVFDMTRRVFRALKDSFPEKQLRVRVADAVFAEVFPGVLRRLLPLWQGRVKLVFHKINYATIRGELVLGLTLPGYPSLGIGWDVMPETESDWAFRLQPPIRSVLIAPADRCGFDPEKELSHVAAGLLPDQPLFLLNQDQRPASLEPFLEGVPETRIVDCTNYNAILNLVRKERLGAAVVPFWPWVLDKIARKHEHGIRYAFLPLAASQHVTYFVPPKSELSQEVKDVIAAVRDSLAELYPETNANRSAEGASPSGALQKRPGSGDRTPRPAEPPLPPGPSETTRIG